MLYVPESEGPGTRSCPDVPEQELTDISAQRENLPFLCLFVPWRLPVDQMRAMLIAESGSSLLSY